MQLDDSWLIACLCADWCGTCRDYRAVLEAFAREHRQARCVWIDIEDHADALGSELDVENFPTLLVLRGGAPRFFGTVLPHASTLRRTVEAAQAAPLTAELPHGLRDGVLALAEQERVGAD